MFALKIARRLDGYWVAYIDTGTLPCRYPLRAWFDPRGVIGVDPDWRGYYDREVA